MRLSIPSDYVGDSTEEELDHFYGISSLSGAIKLYGNSYDKLFVNNKLFKENGYTSELFEIEY